MAKTFDLAVIGAGPGGYIAAVRAAQLGFGVVCIDDFKGKTGKASLGGTCLNVGCIPSKALLESSENYERALHKFGDHGIGIKEVSLDVGVMLARKDKIVEQFTGGIGLLFKKNKVSALHGRGRFLSAGDGVYRIEVKDGDKAEMVEAKHVVIATGSVPRQLPEVPIDNDRVCDNAGALSFADVPKRLGVIGAGVVGLEMGSVWKRLGAEVTILEALPAFLGAADDAIAKEARRVFTKTVGLDIRTGCKIASVKAGKKSVTVAFNDGESDQKMEFDRLIVAIGRVPNSTDIGAESVRLKLDARGFIEVDDRNRTNLPNVYAIGDVVRGPMLAHKASEEGVAVAETMAGQHGHVNLDTVPWVIYTSPEIAWVGKTEQQLKAEGIEYRSGQFPFIVNGRARALGETAGFVKMLAHATTDRILGVHILGPFASELIAEAVMAMEFGASSEDIARIVHAHPSLSEALHEAAFGVDKRYLNL